MSVLLHLVYQIYAMMPNKMIYYVKGGDVMKVYISQPNAYLDNAATRKERADIISDLNKYLKDPEILDSYIEKDHVFGLEQLSKSILVMSKADTIVFAKGWENSKGCRIEHQIAQEFNLSIIDLGK